MVKNDFCVFIISNNRPNKVLTYDTLKKSGYTGKIFLVIDDQDKTVNQYKKTFSNVIVFSKQKQIKNIDQMDNFNYQRSTGYARNKCFEIAKNLKYKYFIVLDDDYRGLYYRKVKKNKLAVVNIKNMDIVFNSLIKFLKNTPTKSIALAQGGDFIGGVENVFAVKGGLKRKAMNSFVCSTDKPFKFFGGLNEDVNTYLVLGKKGYLFFTTHLASLKQKQTQKINGGMSEAYNKNGTYVKSFYSVLCSPSSVKIYILNTNHKRIHHSIKWKNAVPKILAERYKKY